MTNSISTRIIAITILMVVLSSASLLLVSVNEHQAAYRNAVSDNLSALSQNLAEALVESLAEPDAPGFLLQNALLGLTAYRDVKYAAIMNTDGQVLAEFFSEPAQQDQVRRLGATAATLPYGVRILGDELIAHRLIGEAEYPLGQLVIINEYRQPLRDSFQGIVFNSLPIASAILLGVLLLAIWLNRRILDPLTRLAEFADSIESSSNYGRRFDYSGDDEIGHLTKDINDLLERVQAQDEQNRAQLETLAEQQKALQQLANFDALTGLANRKHFTELLRIELANSKRRESNVVILFLDLDQFKSINDTLGHEAGDMLLQRVSRIVQSALRDGDVLSRLGGDEFLIMLPNIRPQDLHVSISVAERIIDSLRAPLRINDWEMQTGVSIGIADAISARYDADTLISNADIAMYRAKDAGRNTYAMFQQQLQQESVRKLQIANAIGYALSAGEFDLLYQPKVACDGRVTGVEALLRWESAFGGALSPAEFIPVAEHSGKINQISRWVISHAFADLQRLRADFGSSVVMSLNLSANDIRDKGMLGFIKAEMARFDVDPALVEFEVTESAYLHDFERADAFFTEIHHLGFSTALDDFGTGYSSLNYLTRIRMNTLKIDRQFVNAIGQSRHDDTIIDTIIDLAHNLQLTVCAEGVETPEQRAYLIAHGCQQMQGFLFARPAAIEDLPEVASSIRKSFRRTVAGGAPVSDLRPRGKGP